MYPTNVLITKQHNNTWRQQTGFEITALIVSQPHSDEDAEVYTRLLVFFNISPCEVSFKKMLKVPYYAKFISLEVCKMSL